MRQARSVDVDGGQQVLVGRPEEDGIVEAAAMAARFGKLRGCEAARPFGEADAAGREPDPAIGPCPDSGRRVAGLHAALRRRGACWPAGGDGERDQKDTHHWSRSMRDGLGYRRCRSPSGGIDRLMLLPPSGLSPTRARIWFASRSAPVSMATSCSSFGGAAKEERTNDSPIR